MNANDTGNRAAGITILIVDDEPMVLKTIEQICKRSGYQTLVAETMAAAQELAKHNAIDIALLDYNLPDATGVDLVRHLKEISPNILSIIITGFGTIERAVDAMQAGAWDFITKPISANLLIEKIQRVEEICFLRREQNFRNQILNRDFEYSGVIGPSIAMQPVYEAIVRAADSTLPVLIEGETGSGKEYIAEAIHLNSKRKTKPFVIMDCTATPNSLIESTLFGSTKGAFTGALERKGLLDAAHEGTLFLDEVGEIAEEIQPKLLRCLETKCFRPVGSTKEIKSNFRILCATNRDLLRETKEGKFRQDLYYRISAIRISVPPLREHASDIPTIAQHFLNELCQEQNTSPTSFSPGALERLKRYSWPGNIRQLKFVVENAFFASGSQSIDAHHLQLEGDSVPVPLYIDQPTSPEP
ncbi:MAG: sigma-54 dependent transcriptional regulator, partial [bacterium]|nr:sigma-54 dependent transcriptional regulator [bacterium]